MTQPALRTAFGAIATVACCFALAACASTPGGKEDRAVFGPDMGSLPLLRNARTRSVCAENPTGEKGKGAMAVPQHDQHPAKWLGKGWKVRPKSESVNVVTLPATPSCTVAS